MNKKQLVVACGVLFLSGAVQAATPPVSLADLLLIINNHMDGKLVGSFCYERMQQFLLAGHDNRADCCAIVERIEKLVQEDLLDVVRPDELKQSIQRALHVLDATNKLVRADSEVVVYATKFDVIETARERVIARYRELLEQRRNKRQRRGACDAVMGALQAALKQSGL